VAYNASAKRPHIFFVILVNLWQAYEHLNTATLFVYALCHVTKKRGPKLGKKSKLWQKVQKRPKKDPKGPKKCQIVRKNVFFNGFTCSWSVLGLPNAFLKK
jgi:hypothetical protein